MSEISFIRELGDSLEQALAPKIAPAVRRRRLPRWLSRRAAVGLGILAVGGGAATAATVFDQGTTTLVARGLSCISGTNNDAHTDAYNVPQNGDSPTSACAALIGIPAGRLVACADTRAGVIVYESNNDPNQCQSLGLTPLPADYTTAIGQIHALGQALTADYNKADCIPPRQLAQEADADLQQLGFTGWHAVVDTSSAAGAEYAGPCGEFPATGAYISTATAALDASNHTVTIDIGASRPALELAKRTAGALLTASGQQCYTLTTAQQLVHDTLNTAAGDTVPVKFAVAQEPPGSQTTDSRQHYYDQGCTIVAGFGTASDGQTFLVLLENKTGTPQPAEGSTSQGLPPSPEGLPTNDFKPELTNG